MDILISNGSSLPIYQQISSQIKKAIISEELDEGSALPSIRKLAAELQVSVITTKRAYEDLEHEGLLESVPGKGFYVAPKNRELLKEKKMQLIESKLIEVIEEASILGLTKDELFEIINLLYE